ncbi:hypothetical protein F5Y17DRAFT_455649 [Xylariaceae sp. FL0594]|nr:hypothetical protein F5Y17DRAFT_455649 [Xylariaceae sp. FL0594]
MQFTTAFLGAILAAAGTAMASPASVEARQQPVGTCGSQFGAPITAFPIGEACNGNGFACDPTCHSIIQCSNGIFVTIADCGGNDCAGNHNGGAVCG